MNIRLILGILVSIVINIIAIIIQLGKYKKVVEESIEYENFRKEVRIVRANREKRTKRGIGKTKRNAR